MRDCSSSTFSISSGERSSPSLFVDLVVARQQRLDRRHALLDVAEDGLGGVEPRLLLQEPDRDALGRKRFAEKARVLARHDLQQRALPGAVEAQHADLGAEIERQPDVFENLGIGRMHLPETLHGVDELRHRLLRFDADFRLKID